MDSIQKFLEQNGFKKELDCPDCVNRWMRTDGESHFTSTYYASITLNHEGIDTEYGFVLFHSHDGMGYVVQKRKFSGSLSQKEIMNLLDIRIKQHPKIVKIYQS